MDTTELLQPIRDEMPCGDDLEYDTAFLELERLGQPRSAAGLVGSIGQLVAVEPVDWKAVRLQADRISSRTKDVRVLLWSMKAALHLSGLEEFCTSLGSLRAVLERYWQDIHPSLVADPDGNLLLRLNILQELCDREGFLLPLRGAALARVHGLGSISLRDIDVALGEPSGATQLEGRTADMATIDAVLGHCDIDELRATFASLRSAVEDVAALETFVRGQVGVSGGISLEPLTEMLERMLGELTVRAGARLEASEASVDAEASEASEAREAVMEVDQNEREDGAQLSDLPSPVVSSSNGAAETVSHAGHTNGLGVAGVRTRDDVVRVLDLVCDYYAQHEPSSPVPILLRRAQRLASMSFLDIMRELAPAGIAEIEVLRGPQEA